MKTETEVIDKLAVLEKEVKRMESLYGEPLSSFTKLLAQERVNALEWVLEENEEW